MHNFPCKVQKIIQEFVKIVIENEDQEGIRKYIREMYVGEHGRYDLGLRWEQWMTIHSRRSFYFLKNLLEAIKLFS